MHLCWKLALIMMMMMILVCDTEQNVTAALHSGFNPRQPSKVEVSCCKEVSKGRIPLEYKVTGFRRLNALDQCVEAMVIYTDKGTFCTDPEARWIQNRLKDLIKNEE